MEGYQGKSAQNENQVSLQNDLQQKGPQIETKFSSIANASPQSQQMQNFAAIANGSAYAQRMTQLHAIANGGGAEGASTFQQPKNNTGLPDQLKSGIESLGGYSMDDVRVHYNSSKPAQLQAHAYAQGTEIHIAPGQEKHLPHEAWHVVQQKQGRVKPTLQMKGIAINDDSALEKEADVMGAKAMGGGGFAYTPQTARTASSNGQETILQPVWINGLPIVKGDWKYELYRWHEIVDGLIWYLIMENDGDSVSYSLYYQVQDTEFVDVYYKENEGVENRKPITEWLKDGTHWIQNEEEDEKKISMGTMPISAAGVDRVKELQAKLSLIKAPKVKDLRKIARESSLRTLNLAEMRNMQCEKFAIDFQSQISAPNRLSVLFKFRLPKGFVLDREITIDDETHPYHDVEVGSDYHYATIVKIEEEYLIFDNHHLDGVSIDNFLDTLKFQLLEVSGSTSTKVEKSAAELEPLIQVRICDASKGKEAKSVISNLNLSEFRAAFK